MKEHLAGKRFANDEDMKDTDWIIRRLHDMKKVGYTQTDAKVRQGDYVEK